LPTSRQYRLGLERHPNEQRITEFGSKEPSPFLAHGRFFFHIVRVQQPTPDGEMMKALMMTAASAALLLMSGMAAADSAEGMSLAQQNACLSCHGVDKKIVGPAYKDVAKKYAGVKGAEDMLVAKVKAGGKGVWGQIPMPPNPQVSVADAHKIVAWVLSLK
jgi:cytochrome c